MFKFILKRTGFSDFYQHFFVLGVGFILIFSGLNLFKFLQNNNTQGYEYFLNILFCFIKPLIIGLIIVLITFALEYFVDFLRKKIPYETKIIYEENKKYKVKYFPEARVKKFYHNGKLHRENDAAVVFDKFSQYQNQFYLNGVRVSKEKLKTHKIKNKVNSF